MTLEVTAATFEAEVLKSDKPVLVDFWAPWCGPCRGMAPILDDLAKDREATLKVVKLNVDENQSVSDDYKIRGIPAFLMFKEGKVIGSIVGSQSKADFYKWADETAALPASSGKTLDEYKTTAAESSKEDEAKLQQKLAGLMKGPLGRVLFGVSAANHALTIAGGLIVAATSAVAAAPLVGTVAVAAGMYRLYNAAVGRANMVKDPEGALKKTLEEANKASVGRKLANAALGLVLGAGVLATGVILVGTVGHVGVLAGIGAALLGGKMALGGAASTLFHGSALIKARPTPEQIAEAIGPESKEEPKQEVKPAPAPAPQPATPQPTAAPQFDAAATAAAANKTPETPAPIAPKAPDVKPPAPQQ